MNKLFQKGIISAAISLVAVLGVGTVVSAQDDYNTPTSPDQSTTLREEKKRLREELKQKRTADREEKMQALRKDRCEKHKAHLDKIIGNVEARSQHVYDRITKISELIKKFYVKKELEVAEYDTLMAEVNAKKALAKEQLDILLANNGIDCDAESPRAMVKELRDARKDKIEAMKAYRQSVLKLLQAVRQAAIDQLSARVEAKEEKE